MFNTAGGFNVAVADPIPPTGLDFSIYDKTNLVYRASGKDLYQQSLPVGTSNTFTLDISEWVKADDIDTVEITAANFAVGGMGFDNETASLGVYVTSLSKGRYPIHFTWDMESGRKGCFSGYVNCTEC